MFIFHRSKASDVERVASECNAQWDEIYVKPEIICEKEERKRARWNLDRKPCGELPEPVLHILVRNSANSFFFFFYSIQPLLNLEYSFVRLVIAWIIKSIKKPFAFHDFFKFYLHLFTCNYQLSNRRAFHFCDLSSKLQLLHIFPNIDVTGISEKTSPKSLMHFTMTKSLYFIWLQNYFIKRV